MESHTVLEVQRKPTHLRHEAAFVANIDEDSSCGMLNDYQGNLAFRMKSFERNTKHPGKAVGWQERKSDSVAMVSPRCQA